ncbi:AAA family ATPase [Candidatus Uhrbacteria bacterium]|nr:AAA family ATPase [Candidatus Uhrbacteria bacterium]
METSVFNQVIGHQAICRLLMASFTKPASAYLFFGPKHVGKATVAEVFIRSLLGLTTDQSYLSHPDFFCMKPLEEKTIVSVEQVRDFRESAYLRPIISARKVLFFPLADRLNEQGMNALLKLMEEPPADAVFILIAEDISRIPRTVQSRSVMLSFVRVPNEYIVESLVQRGVDNDEARLYSSRARGLPGLALAELQHFPLRETDIECHQFCQRFLDAKSAGQRLEVVEELSKWCDAQDDATACWKAWCMIVSRTLIQGLGKNQDSILLSWGVLQAMCQIGSSVSPRLALEAAITRVNGSPSVVSHLPYSSPVIYSE